MTRRANKLTTVAVDFIEPEAFGRFALISGCWGPGMWKHRAVWRLEIVLVFREPCWRMTSAGVQCEGFRPSGYYECREHWVYAKTREGAMSAMVRDIKQDPRHEVITRIAIAQICPPLSVQAVHEIEAINNQLAREREARRRPRRSHRQLEFEKVA